MALITNIPPPNIWDEICKEFQSQKPPFPEDETSSFATDVEEFDPAKHSPVFYGTLFAKECMTENFHCIADNPEDVFDASKSHPAAAGYTFVNRPPPSPAPPPPDPPDYKRCSPRDYLEHYIFPVLLPAMEAMLHRAKIERCFERKRTKFNALDFLTEYLYCNNPEKPHHKEMKMEEIPFVKEEWTVRPRPPLALSVVWTEEEAISVIQRFWRGYMVRRDPEIEELRVWQKEWRDINRPPKEKIAELWGEQLADESEDIKRAVPMRNLEMEVREKSPVEHGQRLVEHNYTCAAMETTRTKPMMAATYTEVKMKQPREELKFLTKEEMVIEKKSILPIK